MKGLVDYIISEIDVTVGARHNVVFSSAFYDASTIDAAQDAYLSASASSDLILTLGGISTQAISQIAELTTPVIGLGVVDPKLQNIPFENGVSGKPNFTYVWQTGDLVTEIDAFRTLTEFEHLAVLVDENFTQTVDVTTAENYLDSISVASKTQFSFITVNGDDLDIFRQFPEDIDAVYLTLLLSQDEAQMRQLIQGINERKLPSFAGNSRFTELGILGSLSNENDLGQTIRKMAIAVDDMLSGTNASYIPVTLSTKSNLYVNVGTARSIEMPIPFEVLFTANLIGEDDLKTTTYSFSEVVEKALEANLEIQVSYKDIELADMNTMSAKSTILPNLQSGLTGLQINKERASAAFNNPERSLTADISISQVLYSEQAVASIKIAQYLKRAQEYETESQVLRIIYDTFTAYLNVLGAKTNLTIQRENLANTKKNNELAELRVTIGSSSNADLYRWESELAFANQSVIQAQTSLIAAKLQLNTLLANNLDDEYDIADISLDGELFSNFTNSALAESVRTPESLKFLSDFLVAESQLNHPNKRRLLENIQASNRQLQQNRRLLFIPTIAVQAQSSHVLERGGQGSQIDASAMALGINEFQNNSWLAAISLTYPIFTGRSRRAEIQKSTIALEQLELSETLLDQNLELGVRASVLELLTSRTNIDFSNAAAESALKNFELVQENYRQGQVSVTQLIDAQQAAVEAQLASAFSIYQYVQAHLNLEFNIGAFTMFMTETDLEQLEQRLNEYTIPKK